jgi:AcrR family transcriptional regulator
MTTIKKTNYATIRTKKLIKRTFSELLAEKRRIEDITVSELVKKADINRGTFYNHYPNIKAVADEIYSDLTAGFFTYPAFTRLNDFDEYYLKIFTFIQENEFNISHLLQCDRIISYLADLQSRSETFFKSKCIESGIELNREIESTISFFCSGIISVIVIQLYQNQRIDLEDMIQFRKLWFRKLFSNYQ